jgi:putative GTP pyrophosphokinase
VLSSKPIELTSINHAEILGVTQTLSMSNSIPERDDILAAYDKLLPELAAGILTLNALIESVLSNAEQRVHEVSKRVKARDSLARKLDRPDARFASLEEVHDVVGLRVITYFEDEVAKVDSILRSEFEVDDEKSGDRGKRLGAREFGYQSLHLIAKLGEKRSNLSEYSVLQDRLFEVQVRSILQHAWAEIEHDLGYKNENAVPDLIRHRFSRVAAFLEAADEDFCKIRRDLIDYDKTLATKLTNEPEKVDVNGASLRLLLDRSGELRSLDHAIASAAGAQELVGIDSEVVEKLVSRLEALDLRDIRQVADAVEKHYGTALRFASDLLGGSRVRTIQQGLGLYYVLFSVLATRDEKDVAQHLDRFLIGPANRRQFLAERIVGLRRPASEHTTKPSLP